MPLRNYAPADYSTLSVGDWAYLAGLIDGEGSIYTRKRHGSRSGGGVCLNIASTHLPILEEFGEKLGGSLYLGVPTHLSKRRHFQLKFLKGNRQLAILEGIYPYLRIKRWQAATAILYLRRNGLDCRGSYDDRLLEWLKQANGYRSF